MGFWSDTFGGGNSFSESVANTFTPNDGASYVGGTLEYDSGDNKGSTVPVNSSGGYGDDGNGNALYSGGGNSETTSASDTNKNTTPTEIKGTAGKVSAVLNNTLFGKGFLYLTGVDTKEDKSENYGNRAVYTRKDGTSYSYNFLGLPYDIKQDADGNVMLDDSGNPMDGTDYARIEQLRASGDNDAADQLEQLQQANQTEEAAGDNPLSAESILEMAMTAGVVSSDQEISNMVSDPVGYLSDRGMTLSDLVSNNGVLLDPDAEGTGMDSGSPDYALGDSPAYTAGTVDTIATVDDVVAGTATTYDASTTADLISGNPEATADAVSGEIRDENLVNASDIEIDINGAATGVNADGTTNVTGEALNDYATLDISTIIDTSTAAGKLLADKLGEGNYTDSKSTILGQMKIISEEFKDSNGNPVIPPWAQSLSRSVGRTMAFSGVSGSAATAAMSTAIMEATLGIAEKEATFFQTITTKNLDNRQQAIINKANVLAQFEVANLDARQAAAVQNAKAFLEMDMTNLDNAQQAEIINTQAMVDALFNDQAAINAARLFGAEQTNDFQKFYDNLTSTVQMHNTEMANSMAKFNIGEINDASEFNANMENGRQKFYAEMQYNIDKFNATWRQEVATTNSEMLYDAYALDVKNSFDLSQEGLNRMWDRVDSLLDYIFTATENESTRDMEILKTEIMAQANSGSGSSGLWGAIGSIGAALITKSDVRLKDNIQAHSTTPNGINVYTWDWNETALEMGLADTPGFGVLAQEVQKTHPEAVIEGTDGYLMVNYGKLQ
jgi:hypothetical protein